MNLNNKKHRKISIVDLLSERKSTCLFNPVKERVTFILGLYVFYLLCYSLIIFPSSLVFYGTGADIYWNEHGQINSIFLVFAIGLAWFASKSYSH